ncbi:protein SON isoform X2 [Nasonia vitripennis]|uniref:Uncharacterized protein n=1 Tax=Nasonia vitripennis TaxID=7425 RepID=A0A7M7ISA2_NASVI|nr:protein SON isoform X2 [Nasonia vitripennis]
MNCIQFHNKREKTTNQLPLQFPVSSGQQHRKNESKDLYSNFVESTTPYQTISQSSANTQYQTNIPYQAGDQYQANVQYEANAQYQANSQYQAVPSGPGVMEYQTISKDQHQSIFSVNQTVDVNALVQQRWAAMKKLYENPNSVEAMNEMYEAQSKMQSWLKNKQVPGQFTGSTGAKVLTADELSSGYQAWAHQDQLLTAQPVTGGMGMALLLKMGWKPGEGLGKHKKGTIEPLSFRIKLDKSGLASNEDVIASMQKLSKVSNPSVPNKANSNTLQGKHPVSLLGEYCSKRKYGAPRYQEFCECGPDKKKSYLFMVVVNGITYKPAVANPNKKLAKVEAAQLCLQSLGVLP